MGFIDRLKEIFPTKIVKQGPADTVFINVPSAFYTKELAVYTGVSLIANAISQSEFRVYKGGKSVKDEDYYSLNIRPNKNESGSQLWHKVAEKILYNKDGALCFIHNRELFCADSFCIERERPFLGNIYSGVVVQGFQMDRKFTSDQVMHFKLENRQAAQLISQMYDEYGKIISAAMDAYKGTNASRYVLKIEGVQAGDEKFNEEFEKILKEPIQKFVSGENKVLIEYSGRTLSQMESSRQAKSADDVINTTKQVFELAGKALHIPEGLMTGNITNMNDVVKAFLTFGVDPIADMISKNLTGAYGMSAWKAGNYYKLDTSGVNHVDIFDMAGNIDKLISSAFMSIDEVRGRADLDQLGEEWSRRHVLTKNYEFIDEKSKQIGGEET